MTKAYLGIDVGGTKTKAVLVIDTKTVKVVVFSTPRSKKPLLKALSSVVNDMKKSSRISGIGLGIAGMVDEHGILLKAPNLAFLNGWDARSFLKKFSPCVVVENDVRTMLFAEHVLGAVRGEKSAVAIAIGTGIGGALLLNGSIYRGVQNSAGEIGHMLLANNTTFEKLGARSTRLSPRDRIEALGKGVANIINILNPEIVVLGGGAIVDGHVSTARIGAASRKYIASPAAKKTPIVATRLGEFAQAKGAALLAAR